MLIEISNCYISLHRSEGLGLGMAEAMKIGTVVIATNYSGNLTFMDSSNSLLINYVLHPLSGDLEYPYGNGNHWADVNIEEASEKMNLIIENKEIRDNIINNAKKDIKKYTIENQSKWINNKLQEIIKNNNITKKFNQH